MGTEVRSTGAYFCSVGVRSRQEMTGCVCKDTALITCNHMAKVFPPSSFHFYCCWILTAACSSSLGYTGFSRFLTRSSVALPWRIKGLSSDQGWNPCPLLEGRF